MLKFRAAVTNIYKHDKSNGFSILRVKPLDDTDDGFFKKEGINSITVVGKIGEPEVGLSVAVEGFSKQHVKFGMQISAQSIYPSKLTAKDHTAGLLFSGLIRSIDKSEAGRIWDAFGEGAIGRISSDPESVKKQASLSDDVSKRLSTEVERLTKNSIPDQFNFLRNLHIAEKPAANIVELFGRKTIGITNQSPYSLTAAPGVGFKTVDSLALKLGVKPDSDIRVASAINNHLEGAISTGNTAINKDQLIDKSSRSTGLDRKVIEDAVNERIKSNHLIQVGSNVVDYGVRKKETEIADEMARLTSFAPAKTIHPRYSSDFLSTEQKSAVESSLNNQVLILTGGPGTGKTTTVKEIIQQHENVSHGDIEILISAPTGKAARRAGQASGRESATLHSILEFNPEDGFRRNKNNPLTADIVIIDEFSMTDLDLFNALLQAMPDKSKLIFVGDTNQLPSVGPGNILGDLITSNTLEISELQKIHRQAKSSKIVVGAHAIKNGNMPIFGGEESDFHFIKADTDEEILDKIKELNSLVLPRDYGIRPDNIQVLTPQRSTEVGIENLNSHLQSILNPKDSSKYSAAFFGQEYRVGDRVMQTKNDKDLDIFNGEVGKITFFDYKQKEAWISFDNNLKKIPFSGFSDMKLAYAATIHKSQGSEYEGVIMPISDQHKNMLSRQLVYTGLTRGKKQVFFVGSEDTLASAIDNTREMQRCTMLSDTLKEKMPQISSAPNANHATSMSPG